jgi:tetratricopeptide (TPR) repeat protein
MLSYLEYSRFAVADITGLNANVFYELGHRHRARASGTAISRQTGGPLPFDINQIKAFPYDYAPETAAVESRQLITRVLHESLEQNRPDSPVRRALNVQQERGGDVERLLEEAENALRNQDPATAIDKHRQAIAGDPDNPLVRLGLGLLLKNRGDWEEALEQFVNAGALSPDYGEAHRERGIAENKIFKNTDDPPDGEAELRTAVALNPQDFDALASLGGVLKRNGNLAGSLEAYEKSTQVSRGHSYPLLNAVKIKAAIKGALDIDAKTTLMLKRAEKPRRAQVGNEPPYDAPWSHFDLAEIQLYFGDAEGSLKTVDDGLLICEHSWQPQTFRDSLALLVEAGITLPGLTEVVAKLDEMIPLLD